MTDKPPPSGSALRRIVAENTKRLRADRDLTQAALAKKAGFNIRFVQAIEGAEKNLTIGTLAKLAAALGVDVTTLLRRPPR